MTPKSYLSFLNGYKAVYFEKKTQIGDMADRMNTGGLILLFKWDFFIFFKCTKAREKKNQSVSDQV